MSLMLFVERLELTASVCRWCREGIRAGEFAPTPNDTLHLVCLLRTVAGSVGHQSRGAHLCDDNCPPDDPDLTTYEAAVAAYRYNRAHNVPKGTYN